MMVETCPICKVHSLENRICECCGYIANKSGVNVIPALIPNEYSVSMRYHQGKITCNCAGGPVCENQK